MAARGPNRPSVGAIIGAALLIAVVFGSIGPNAMAGTEILFPRPAAIEPNVQFWANVFGVYSERDFIIHDRTQLWRIYQVFHLPGEGPPSREQIDWVNGYLKAKYEAILMRLGTGRLPAGYEDQRVAQLFKGAPLSAYTLAAQNLRVQEGLRERFRESLLRSRHYLPSMERTFRMAGLPVELATLAEIESGFNRRARSKAGAVGIWQFTRATARDYDMRINRHHDDRLSPIRSTEAAAKLLRHNYNTLGDWPLAITAYNYGTAGMQDAAATCGSDYCRVLDSFRGSRFGFAARNYYPEFLAALQVNRYEDAYFPGLKDEPTPPLPRLIPVSSRSSRHAHHHHRHIHHRRRFRTHRSRYRTHVNHSRRYASARRHHHHHHHYHRRTLITSARH